jgi:hypothetical protein
MGDVTRRWCRKKTYCSGSCCMLMCSSKPPGMFSSNVYMSRLHTRHLLCESVSMVFLSSRMASNAEAIKPVKMLSCTGRGRRKDAEIAG